MFEFYPFLYNLPTDAESQVMECLQKCSMIRCPDWERSTHVVFPSLDLVPCLQLARALYAGKLICDPSFVHGLLAGHVFLPDYTCSGGGPIFRDQSYLIDRDSWTAESHNIIESMTKSAGGAILDNDDGKARIISANTALVRGVNLEDLFELSASQNTNSPIELDPSDNENVIYKVPARANVTVSAPLMCWSISADILRKSDRTSASENDEANGRVNFKKFKKAHIRTRIPSIIAVGSMRPSSGGTEAIGASKKSTDTWLKDTPTPTDSRTKHLVAEHIDTKIQESSKFKSALFKKASKGK
jgi:hypothetical protein